jgi:hypothetical protein
MKSYFDSLNNSYDEAPTRLDMAVSLFTRNGTSDAVGSVHARSIRIPTIENVTIEALAQHSGLSVNKVIVQLLEVALEVVFQEMTEEHREQVFVKRSELIALISKDDGSISGSEQSNEGEI